MEDKIIKVLEQHGMKYPEKELLGIKIYEAIMEEHPVRFGRWLLKHTTTHIDKDGMFCWMYGKEEIDTNELYQEYLKQI